MALVARLPQPPMEAPTVGGGGAGLAVRRLEFQAMGTACAVMYTAPGGDGQAAAFEREAVAWVGAFEARYSRFRPDSLVSRINAAAGRDWVAVDPETEALLGLCDSFHFMTGGVFDPTALPLIRLWDWKASPPVVPDDAAIARALGRVGWRKLLREPGRVRLQEEGAAIDFGGFGKEYAVDRVAELAAARGLGAALVDFGHDLRGFGAPPGRPAWHIGLEDPENPGRERGSVILSNRGIASSGDYIRAFTAADGRRYGHILDPRTGRPVSNGCTQATVIAPSCLQAGLLSTAAFVLGPERGLELIRSLPGAEGMIVRGKDRLRTRLFHSFEVVP